MGLKKCTYCDGVTVIKAKNMNDIQDAICDLERDAAEVPQLFAGALNGSEEGELVALCDVSPVEHEVAAEVSRKNWADLSTPFTNRLTEVVEQTEGSITVKATGTGTKWLQVCYLLSEELIGETLTLSATWTLSNSASQGAVRVQWVKANGGVVGNMLGYINVSGQSDTFTVTEKPADADGLGMLVYSVADSTAAVAGDTITYTGIQLEKGTIATAYSPYVADPTEAKVQVLGKNWFSSSLSFGGLSGVGGGEFSTTDYVLTDFIEVKPNTTYILSGGDIIPPDYAGRHAYDKDKNWIGAMGRIQSNTGVWMNNCFTTPPNTAYIRLHFAHADRSVGFTQDQLDALNADDIQMEIGTTATAYELYEAPVEYEQGEAIPSVSPEMTITTDTPGALVSVEYNRDINAAFETLTKAIISLGGNV